MNHYLGTFGPIRIRGKIGNSHTSERIKISLVSKIYAKVYKYKGYKLQKYKKILKYFQ